MGADIHGVLQARVKGGAWRSIGEIENSRNYGVFAALADVRNYEDLVPISPPRGLPVDFDITEAVRVMQYGNPEDPWIGDHSFSWLTLEEIDGWSGWGQEFRGEVLSEWCELFTQWLAYSKTRVRMQYWDEARIVFGFDS